MFILLTILPKNVFAQSETNYVLPPLDTIIRLALERSAKLKSQDIWVKTQYHEWQLEKKNWADLVSVGGTALYGNNTLLDYQQNSLGAEQVSTDRRSTVYNAGFIVRFTLGDVINNQEKFQIKQLEYDQATMDRKAMEDEIKEEVMLRYDRFWANQKILQLEAENVEAMHLAYETAKKYFEQGNLSTAEYTTNLSKYIAAQKQLEERKMEAKHQYRMILAIAGLN